MNKNQKKKRKDAAKIVATSFLSRFTNRPDHILQEWIPYE